MAKRNSEILLNKRSLIRIYKANSHISSEKEEARLQKRKEVASRLIVSIESMENKIETMKYHLKR